MKKLLKDVRETCGKTCHLLPLFSCLKLEGAEIFKKNVGSQVRSLATSNSSTGTIVISGVENGSIHIHELETVCSCMVKIKQKVKFWSFNHLSMQLSPE